LCQQSPALPYVKENIGIIEEVLRQTQDLSLELRPSLLDDFGLAAAIRWYINRYGLRTGIVTQAVIDSLIFDARLSRELEINCFRIAQEALTNVARHAEARHARLELQRLNGELVLLVKDDGTGMDLRALRKQNSRATLGLRGMEERALAVGGRIEIHSVPSEGTEIRATFPIRSNKDE
jgi:signal transduction histidine kinase